MLSVFNLSYVSRQLRRLWESVFEKERYQPDRHYMRGPGPATSRKQQLVAGMTGDQTDSDMEAQ